jgi:hypothetical protein
METRPTVSAPQTDSKPGRRYERLGLNGPWLALCAGLALAISTYISYLTGGFRSVLFLSILLSAACVAVFFHMTAQKTAAVSSPYRRIDLVAALGLLFGFAPVYLSLIGQIPYQVNTDEVVLSNIMKATTSEPTDLFAYAENYFHPALAFYLVGQVSRALGGIDLEHVRTAHALLGISVIPLTYLFVRLAASIPIAFAAAVFVGTNHAQFALSRNATMNETAPVIMILALGILLRGFQARNDFILFLGGVCAGFSFYMYSPASMTVAIWFVFLPMAYLLKRALGWRLILRAGLVSGLGIALIAMPFFLSVIRDPASANREYQRGQLLLFAEGREIQRDWLFLDSIGEGVRRNIVEGLTVFNNRVEDRGVMYVNFGHGFVDPLSGVLVWAGFVIVVWRWFKGKREEGEILFMAGFLFLWLLLSFVVNKAPHYLRLLMILPFAGFLIGTGLTQIASGAVVLGRRFHRRWSGLQVPILAGGLAVIAIWNGSIYGDYVSTGFREGHDIAGTVRYAEARSDVEGYRFFVAANGEYPYHWWVQPDFWISLIAFFTSEDQQVTAIDPSRLGARIEERPFTIFMSRDLWRLQQAQLLAQYPRMSIHSVTPDGRSVAIEVR